MPKAQPRVMPVLCRMERVDIFFPGLFAQFFRAASKEQPIYFEAGLMRRARCPLCPLFHTARCTCSAVCRPLDPPVTVMASVIWK